VLNLIASFANKPSSLISDFGGGGAKAQRIRGNDVMLSRHPRPCEARPAYIRK
jgi:hypothetical protein